MSFSDLNVSGTSSLPQGIGSVPSTREEGKGICERHTLGGEPVRVIDDVLSKHGLDIKKNGIMRGEVWNS